MTFFFPLLIQIVIIAIGVYGLLNGVYWAIIAVGIILAVDIVHRITDGLMRNWEIAVINVVSVLGVILIHPWWLGLFLVNFGIYLLSFLYSIGVLLFGFIAALMSDLFSRRMR